MDPVLIIVLVVLAVTLATGAVVAVRRRGRAALPGAPRPQVEAPRRVTLSDRLAKSRQALGGRLRHAFGRGTLDAGFWDELEEALIAADMGVATATRVVGAVKADGPADADEARRFLRSELLAALDRDDRAVRLAGSPAVIVVVGVNGVGKTTTIAKLAARLREQGAESILGAADTFRAAADTQLRTWAERVGTEIVSAEPGSDPASVAFDALAAARKRGKQVVIVDTAGRLHSKGNLMAELGKITKVLEREAGAIDEVLLVLDATTGQNGVAQTEVFRDTVGVTGIVLTKLDGTAKGGIVVAIEQELGIPVKFIGVGEGVEDLVAFTPEDFVDALLADA